MSEYNIFKDEVKVGGMTIPNRFVMAPMTFAAFNGELGYTDLAVEYYTRRAKGGIGMIVTGAIGTDGKVDPYSAFGAIPLNNEEEWITRAKKLTDSVHKEGSKIIAQLSMGLGRNYPMLPAPSVLPVYASDQQSPELTIEQIKLKIQQMIDTSRLAKEAGFDGIEVHAMHWGYLLDQFGMNFFNHRTDEYGGPLENRLRAAKEIVEGMHEVCGKDYPIGMRLGLKTFVKDFDKATLTGEEEVGRTIEEGVEVSKLLEKYGYDFLDVDTGTYDSFYYACPPMYLEQGFMIQYAAKAKEAVSIPVFAGGRMQDFSQDIEALKNNKIDGVTLGRPTLADPDIANKVMNGQLDDIRPCIACNLGCFHRGISEGKPGSCAVNPMAAREDEKVIKPATDSKNVLVVGSGVAGMEAARVLKLRGYNVSLVEATDKLGGHLIEGGTHSIKKEVIQLNNWYIKQLKDLDIDIKLNTTVTVDDINNKDIDAVVLAIGSKANMPPIPGLEKALVSLDAITHEEKIYGHVVVVGGGLVGCEIALDEAKKGHQVTVIEALDSIMGLDGTPIPNNQMMHDLFDYYKIDVYTETKLVEVKDQEIIVENNGQQETISYDTLINALGFKPNTLDTEAIKVPVYIIGDAVSAKTILNAIWTGFDTANEI